MAGSDSMLRLTPTKPRLKKQKGAIEKVIFLAQAEMAKLRKRASLTSPLDTTLSALQGQLTFGAVSATP